MNIKVKPIETLFRKFHKLPGIGEKNALRLTYHILEMDESEVAAFADSLLEAKKNVKKCRICCNFTDEDLCSICSDITRNDSVICVVESPRDVEAMERSKSFHGLYHVLHGTINPRRTKNMDAIKIKELYDRIKKEDIKEVIIATNPTVNGDLTAAYINKIISPLGVKVSRIGHGLPIGGDLEYYDDVTIKAAMQNRMRMKNPIEREDFEEE